MKLFKSNYLRLLPLWYNVIIYNDKDISKADYEIIRFKRIYKKWENRLKTSETINGDDLYEVITFCATNFKMCYMQNVTRKNIKLNKVEYHVIHLPT